MNIGLVNLFPDEDAPPINLVYLGTYLEKSGFNNVRIIDSTYESRDFFKQILQCDIIGISSMTQSYNKAIILAKEIKKEHDIPLIIGGPHISLLPSSLSIEFTVGVIGEGEQTMVDICKVFNKQGYLNSNNLYDIPGIVYWSEGKRITTMPRKQIEFLDDLPMLSFKLLNEQYFKKRWIDWSGRVGISMHISTSRGCPYNCIFCSGTRLWKKTRFQCS